VFVSANGDQTPSLSPIPAPARLARPSHRVMLFLQESEKPVKSSTMVEQVDEYVDIGDEMLAATYQSMEIEKDAEGQGDEEKRAGR
jgi:hypothetical protein